MTRYQAFRDAMEAELRADGYDASYYAGIHEALATHARIYGAEPTEEEVLNAAKAIQEMDDWLTSDENGDTIENYHAIAKAALMAAKGKRG